MMWSASNTARARRTSAQRWAFSTTSTTKSKATILGGELEARLTESEPAKLKAGMQMELVADPLFADRDGNCSVHPAKAAWHWLSVVRPKP